MSVEGKYTFTDRQPTCYTGMDQSLGERAHEDARMGWIQESRASINRALQSALWKRTKSQVSFPTSSGMQDTIYPSVFQLLKSCCCCVLSIPFILYQYAFLKSFTVIFTELQEANAWPSTCHLPPDIPQMLQAPGQATPVMFWPLLV